jgi:protein TonB
MFLQTESGGLPARPLRRRLLPVFLAASVALHAAVVVVVAPPAPDYELAQARVLEVVLVQTEPPRPLPVEPEQAPLPPQRKRAPEREPARAAAGAEPPRRADVAQPVLALPEPNPAGDPVVAVPRAAEKRALPAEARTEIAKAAPTLPGFSAAYLRNPAPRYPVAARRAGEQGTVTLRVLVARDGQPARVDVEKSSGSAQLDAAALEAVRSWRFVPARQGTDAIESWVLVPIVFRLEGSS